MQTSSVDIVALHPVGFRANNHHAALDAALSARSRTLAAALNRLRDQSTLLSDAAAVLVDTLRHGQKILVAGNGGSAAEAQHFATELVGRFQRERAAYPVLALTADTSLLTAVANDYGFEEVFARQVRAFGQPGDTLVAFSTSGESENVVRAARVAIDQGLTVICFSGDGQSRLGRIASLAIRAPSTETPVIQELHGILVHLLCEVVENELAPATPEVVAR